MTFLICLVICAICYSVGYFHCNLKFRNQSMHILTAAWILWHEKRSILGVKHSDIDKAFNQFKEDLKTNNPLERVL